MNRSSTILSLTRGCLALIIIFIYYYHLFPLLSIYSRKMGKNVNRVLVISQVWFWYEHPITLEKVSGLQQQHQQETLWFYYPAISLWRQLYFLPYFDLHYSITRSVVTYSSSIILKCLFVDEWISEARTHAEEEERKFPQTTHNKERYKFPQTTHSQWTI